MSEMIRAAQFSRYGAPDVLTIASVERPSPVAGEILVKVHGSSVNHLDASIRRGHLLPATLFSFPMGTGFDFAGEVVEVGPVTEEPKSSSGQASEVDVAAVTFEPGDRVWGFRPGLGGGAIGTASEYLVVRASAVSHAPTTIDLLDAASLPLVGSTALVALRDHGHLHEGQRLLVRGASGGVGSAAVQLGKSMGAHVTALVGARDLEFVRGLGADDALDYRTHSSGQVGAYDVIMDVVGTRLMSYRRHLTRPGRMVTTAVRGGGAVLASAIYGSRRVRAVVIGPQQSVLADLARRVDEGAVAPIIDSVTPLEALASAHARIETGGVRGKIVIDTRS